MVTKKHMSIDIETTGKKAGCKVLTIGAIIFDRHGLSNNKVRDEFYMRADPYEYDSTKFHTDPDTMKWWNEQKPEIRDEAFGGRLNPYMLAVNLDAYIRETNADYIWCKGASFDFPIINHLLEFYSLPPLPYRGLRCMRGLSTIAGSQLVKNNAEHNALADAEEQAYNIIHALDNITGAWDRYDAD